MTTTTAGTSAHTDVSLHPVAEPEGRFGTLSWAVRDTIAVTGRNLLHYVRMPQLLVFTFIQPVMFVLLFRYVFGGSIPTPIPYVDYLIPGIFGQTVVFGSVATGIGLAEDLNTGIVERFRSLPMTRLSVLAGRTGADLIRNIGVVCVMLVIGLLVGFRPNGGVLGVAAGVLLVLAFAFSMSWVFANVGLVAANGEAAQAVSFPMLFPLTFASSAFVPVGNMPGWLQVFAARQPVTVVINAARGLMLGSADSETLRSPPGGFPPLLEASTASYVLQSLAWIAAILLIAAPLAVRRFSRS